MSDTNQIEGSFEDMIFNQSTYKEQKDSAKIASDELQTFVKETENPYTNSDCLDYINKVIALNSELLNIKIDLKGILLRDYQRNSAVMVSHAYSHTAEAYKQLYYYHLHKNANLHLQIEALQSAKLHYQKSAKCDERIILWLNETEAKQKHIFTTGLHLLHQRARIMKIEEKLNPPSDQSHLDHLAAKEMFIHQYQEFASQPWNPSSCELKKLQSIYRRYIKPLVTQP